MKDPARLQPSDYKEDWLSAYLDDELSGRQREIVESRLESDPEAQQMLADLRRVRKLVLMLPGWQGPLSNIDLPRTVQPSPSTAVSDHSAHSNIERPSDVAEKNTNIESEGSGLKSDLGLFPEPADDVDDNSNDLSTEIILADEQEIADEGSQSIIGGSQEFDSVIQNAATGQVSQVDRESSISLSLIHLMKTITSSQRSILREQPSIW